MDQQQQQLTNVGGGGGGDEIVETKFDYLQQQHQNYQLMAKTTFDFMNLQNGMPHGFAPRYFDYHHHHQQQQQQQHPSQQPPQPKGNGSTSTVSSPSPMSNNSSIGSIQQQQQQAQQQQHQNGINLSLQNGASTNSNGIEPSNIKEEVKLFFGIWNLFKFGFGKMFFNAKTLTQFFGKI
jgi:hypothetical protein